MMCNNELASGVGNNTCCGGRVTTGTVMRSRGCLAMYCPDSNTTFNDTSGQCTCESVTPQGEGIPSGIGPGPGPDPEHR
jgi:hypothetical protein